MPFPPRPQIPRVTVLMPVFHSQTFVLNAIDSVLAQAYPHVELLVIPDDGGTYEFIRHHRKSIQMTILSPDDQNLGPGLSRNRGIDMARGELVAVCDSDDYWPPNYLESLVPLAMEHGAAMAPTRYVDSSGSTVREPPLPPGVLTVSGFGQLLGSIRPVLRRSLEVAYHDVFAEDVLHDMHVIAAMGGHIPVCHDTYYQVNLTKGSMCDASTDQEKAIQEAYSEVSRAIRYHPTLLSLQRLDSPTRNAMADAFDFRRAVSEQFAASGQSCYNTFVAGREAALWDAFQLKPWTERAAPRLLGRAAARGRPAHASN